MAKLVHELPLCVVVNGPSAAGKSTLTTAIQDRADVPLLRFGLDELFRMVPDHWGGGLPGARYSSRGFSYAEVEGAAPGVRQIRCGRDGHQMLLAMNAAILAMLRTGQSVIVDGQAFEPHANTDLERALADAQADGEIVKAVIQLKADDSALASRQELHDHPVGLSLFHNSLPPQSSAPDLEIETSAMSAAEVAEVVWDWLRRRYPLIQGRM